jgi:hypothetical protein
LNHSLIAATSFKISVFLDPGKSKLSKAKIPRGPEADQKNKKDFGVNAELLVFYGDLAGTRNRGGGVRDSGLER